MNATLEEGRCDVVIGVPAGYDLVSTTKPYYRSTYVFVYPKGKGLADQVARRSGSQEAEDRRAPARRRLHEPAAGARARRSAASSTTWSGFSTFYSAENPPSAIIDAVAQRKDRRRDRVGAGGRILRRAATRAAGDGADSVGQGRSAVRVRHLDGRQAGQRGAEECSWRK